MMLYILGVIAVGAIYTILFIYIAPSILYPFIPASIYKTIIVGICYFAPLLVLVTLTIALELSGLKKQVNWGQT